MVAEAHAVACELSSVTARHEQYDRADQMATYISLAVERALTKLGYVKEAAW